MSAHRRWEPVEERDLVALAPVLSLRDLARIFGRSEESIESKARELRQRGVDVAPLGRNAALVRCPECGRWRTGLGASGSCAVCEERRHALDAEREYRESVSRLAPWQRRVVEHEAARERELAELKAAREDTRRVRRDIERARGMPALGDIKQTCKG